MTTSATKREDVVCRRAPLRRGRPPFRSVAKKAVVTAVLVMIVVLPVTTWISSTDNTGSAGAASVRPGRYYVAVYSLPHLPQTIEGHFETWIKHPRKRFFTVRAFNSEGVALCRSCCHSKALGRATQANVEERGLRCHLCIFSIRREFMRGFQR